MLIRKFARFSRISLAAFAVIGLVALTVLALFGEKVLRTQVERRLAEALNRTVTVGALSVDLPRRVVELRDVVIAGLPGSKRPSFSAPRVRLALSFRSLFTSRILLRAFELERPQISVQVFPDGSTDMPRLSAAGGPPSREVSIGNLVVQKGELFLNDQQIPLEIVWPKFEASLAADPKSVLEGSMSAGPGPMRFGSLPAEDARFELALRFADSTLHIDKGAFISARTNLSLSGDVDLRKEPEGQIRLSGPFDLESFDRSMVGTGLDLKGVAEAVAVLSIGGETLQLTGKMKGQAGSYASIPVDAFATSFSFDGSDLRLKDLTLAALGGRAALDVDVPGQGPVRVVGALDSLSAEPLLHWLFDYGTAHLGARVSGPIDLSFPPGAANLLSGSGDLQFTPDPAAGDPFSGTFPFTANAGVVTMNAVQLQAPKTEVTLDGSIQVDRRLSLQLKLASDDLAVTDDLGVRLRVAFGAPDAHPLDATGQGTLQGQVSGTLSSPVVTGRFHGKNLAYLGISWGEVDWTGKASTQDLTSAHLTAIRGPSRVDLSGVQRLGPTGVDDGMDLDIRIKDWPAKDLLHVVDSAVDVQGVISGDVRLLGGRSNPLGHARLTADSGRALGLDFRKAELGLEFQGKALRVEKLNAVLGGGDLQVQGTLSQAEGETAFAGEVDLREVELADLGLQDPEGPMIGGHITGRATLSGPVEKPQVQAHLESKRIFYGDEGIGSVALDVQGSGDGVLNVTGQSDGPRFQANISGSIEAKAPHQSRLEIKLKNVRLDPVLRALGSRFENSVVITASANAMVEGPLLEPDSITARVREGTLKIAVPEYAIEADPGSVIDLEKGAIQIAGLTLKGEGTSLAVSGRLALKGDDQNDLAVTGRADLRVLSGFSRDWRAGGSATLRSQIRGSANDLRVSGGVDIEDGAFRLRTFPQGLDGLNGRVIFNETQARVAGLEGRFGGGRVSVSGQAGFGGTGPPSFDLSFTGADLGLRYPEGLRSTFGATLRLLGTTESHWLTGELLVSKASWTRRYAITSELFASSEGAGFSRSASGLTTSPVHLDIAIKAPGTLRLDNNLASVLASADLTLTGSPTEPQLLGRLEVARGKVFFGGNTYEVRKGVVLFSNPREINPTFDLEADTRLRNYRLTLQANGTLDRVSTRITSDPPLTSGQIASLLTGGDENDVVRVGSSVNDLQTLGAGGLSSFASTLLDDNVTGRVAQGFGLSRLSIDPGKGLLSRTGGSRLRVGKRVTSNIEFIYSRNIFGGADSQLATAEYSLSNRFSLVVSWEQPGGFGIDVRTRITLDK
ncbi:MAG: translocation/assembly module TamB domain-containing protein [Vicinamibacteria bacterium]|nr:translocation/assembly module TamB domain-containing protein [Vicinamibacteria bacterium]